MDELRCVRAIVTGKVQGVFFRASTMEQAQALGVTGTVRNLPDESVEVVAQGTPEQIDALVRWLHRGPPAAKVKGVHVVDREQDPSLVTFRILR